MADAWPTVDAISTTWSMFRDGQRISMASMTIDSIPVAEGLADDLGGGPDTETRSHAEQFSAWAGLVAVALFVAGSLVAGSAPRPDATTGEVTTFLVQHRSALLFGTALILLSVPFFGCFVGLLAGMLRDAEGGRAPLAGAATVGWVLLLAIASIGILVQVALTWRGADRADPGMVRFVYDVSSLSTYAVSATAVALSVGATSFIIFRTRMVPRWIAVFGLVEIVGNLVEVGGMASREGLNAGGYGAGVGPLLWAAWVAAMAIALVRCIGRERAGSRAAVVLD